ncbi:MAG: toll/interleukin-1 receptor domain-containing protein [Chloroflexi bacterium]|nr:toll/interleukin-1 receptor domain-containing protein [Chloroflexota bacterium]
MTKLFISYAHADEKIVQIQARDLQDLGFDVWIDTRGIKGGSLWGSEIVEAITHCNFFLLFVSSGSMASDNVRREVQLAYEKKRSIIPIRLEKVDIVAQLSFPLAGIQWIEYSDSDWKSHLLVALGTGPREITKAEENEAININNVVNESPIIISKIEHLYYNNRLSKDQKESLADIFKEAVNHPMKEEKMTPQEMDTAQVAELYKNSSYTVAHYLTSLTEQQPALLNHLPGDPKIEYAIQILAKIQQQIFLVATVAEIHSPGVYEIYQFESRMILTSIKNLRSLLKDLDKYGSTPEDIPSNVQMNIDEEFDNLIFGTGRILLFMQELAQPNRKSFLQ